jgi:alpha/beta superfamily hydrolase
MQNKVVTTVARTFRRLGSIAVTFNFRGVGRSSGSHDDGIGEREDAIAIARFCRERWPDLRVYLGGFSFGGGVALAAADSIRPRGLVTVAPSITRVPHGFAPPDCPWLLVQGDSDEVLDPSAVVGWARGLTPAPTIALLPGVGHFFHGRLGVLADHIAAFFAPEFASRD